jgi:hypothetical protein
MIKKILSLIVIVSIGFWQSGPIVSVSAAPENDTYDEIEKTFNADDGNFEMTVKEQVKGNDVYVECIVSGFDFSDRGDKKSGQGYINLYLNGHKIDEIYTAAFIIKGLPEGEHEVTLELVKNDGTPYGMKEKFEVTI